MKVLVLGCGPAGLMAVHAAALAGHDVIIVSKARKSHMRGAQYLHEPIPSISSAAERPFQVEYKLMGDPEDYRRKVYGDLHTGSVSPEDLTESHLGWNIRATYDMLWHVYGSYVKDDALDPARIDEVLQWAKPDYTISTIPAPTLCMEGHTFTQQMIWSTDEEMHQQPDNTVTCNGEYVPRWYRAAKIQGWTTTEWPADSRPPLPEHKLWYVPKPLTTNCDCFPDVVRMGRYGKWTKGVLSHEAFFETVKLLAQPYQEKLL